MPGRPWEPVEPGWDIGGNANGGYLMAIAGRAMSEAVGRPPVTLTAHYLRPAPTGRCEIEVTTVRSGRRLATATASLVMLDGDDRRQIIRLLGTFGEQMSGGPSYIAEGPVDIPDYDDCELPQAANAVTYAVGFVVATGLLHLGGIAIGLLIKWPWGRVAVRACGGLIAATGFAFLFGFL